MLYRSSSLRQPPQRRSYSSSFGGAATGLELEALGTEVPVSVPGLRLRRAGIGARSSGSASELEGFASELEGRADAVRARPAVGSSKAGSGTGTERDALV